MQFNLESFNTIIGLAVTFNFAATIISSTDKVNFITICIKNVFSIEGFTNGVIVRLKTQYNELKKDIDEHLISNPEKLCENCRSHCDVHLKQIDQIKSNANDEYKRIFESHHIGHLCMFLGLIGLAQLFAISYIELNNQFWKDVILNLNVFTIFYLILFVFVFQTNKIFKRRNVFIKTTEYIKTNYDKFAISQSAFILIVAIALIAPNINCKYTFMQDTFQVIVYFITPFVTFLCFIAHFFIFIVKAKVNKNRLLDKDAIIKLEETLKEYRVVLKTAKNTATDPFDIDSDSKHKVHKKK